MAENKINENVYTRNVPEKFDGGHAEEKERDGNASH